MDSQLDAQILCWETELKRLKPLWICWRRLCCCTFRHKHVFICSHKCRNCRVWCVNVRFEWFPSFDSAAVHFKKCNRKTKNEENKVESCVFAGCFQSLCPPVFPFFGVIILWVCDLIVLFAAPVWSVTHWQLVTITEPC